MNELELKKEIEELNSKIEKLSQKTPFWPTFYFDHKKPIKYFVITVLFIGVAARATFTLPFNNFQSGTPIRADEINANFNALASQLPVTIARMKLSSPITLTYLNGSNSNSPDNFEGKLNLLFGNKLINQGVLSDPSGVYTRFTPTVSGWYEIFSYLDLSFVTTNTSTGHVRYGLFGSLELRQGDPTNSINVDYFNGSSKSYNDENGNGIIEPPNDGSWEYANKGSSRKVYLNANETFYFTFYWNIENPDLDTDTVLDNNDNSITINTTSEIIIKKLP